MNISTPVKEYLNPWMAFAVVGILQGGVYGQCNMYFSKTLGIGKTFNIKGMFRGVAFAGCRDMISQGVPFMFSAYTRQYVFDNLFPTTSDSSNWLVQFKYWGSVLTTSMIATVASQGVHNCQITIQADQSLTYKTTLEKIWSQHGFRMFYKGAEARIGLLLVVNILNELLLKPAWAGVDIE
jgi:hypothetical protein